MKCAKCGMKMKEKRTLLVGCYEYIICYFCEKDIMKGLKKRERFIDKDDVYHM